MKKEEKQNQGEESSSAQPVCSPQGQWESKFGVSKTPEDCGCGEAWRHREGSDSMPSALFIQSKNLAVALVANNGKKSKIICLDKSSVPGRADRWALSTPQMEWIAPKFHALKI